jgi:hypothetical protein
VFHPGHSELHGITVVVETADQTTYVGRYHEETGEGLLLHDVAEHQLVPGGPSRSDFMRQILKFGVKSVHRHLVVPTGVVRDLTRLVDWHEPATGK